MENQSTHFIFDGKQIIISPDLYPTIGFLQEIEKEIESFLDFDKKLEIYHPVRSKMIILFANLETLLRLNFAYENRIDDGEEIRKQALDPKVWGLFYNDFCLNENNQWGQKNQERLKHITAYELRYLRNSLTHFFSVDKGLQIADVFLDEKSRILEKLTSFHAKFISPEDLYEIIKGAAKLMIEKWSRDCQECLKTSSNEFKEKILSVNKLITSSGAVIVKSEQMDMIIKDWPTKN
jgi:hypothetical protein